MSCETMSRPRLPVPSQCVAEGGCSLLGTSISVAERASTKDSSASATSNITSTAGDEALCWRNARCRSSSVHHLQSPRVDHRIDRSTTKLIVITVAAISITSACTSGRSRLPMAWKISRPRPGSENTFSITTVPVTGWRTAGPSP